VAARAAAATPFRRTVAFNAASLKKSSALAAAIDAAYYVAQVAVQSGPEDEDGMTERKQQADLLREIVGNPLRATNPSESSRRSVPLIGKWFRPATPLDRWRREHPDVERLARDIYEGRSYGDLPRLAKALEESGCPDADLAAHCRMPGEHVRGCWALGTVLGINTR
jgi:hypothetical protein